jgi:metallo-beta-lactamase family protein
MSTRAISFWGAAGQVTGSCHVVEWDQQRFLLDAGLFQGRRAESRALNAVLPFDPRHLDAVILSHAHIDHSGRLPLLVARQFDGPIHATPATRDLCAVMLPDSAHIQESDYRWLLKKGRVGDEAMPLYTMADALHVQELMHGHPYNKKFRINGSALRATFHDAGHILGSASVEIADDNGHRLVFSGDIGRWNQPIIRDPSPPPAGPVDTLIIESTYAGRHHETTTDATRALGEVVRKVAGRGGKLLIPSFAVGRAQELVYALHQLLQDDEIPSVPIYIDSPLALEATAVFRMHPEIFDTAEEMISDDARIFDHRLVRFVRSVEESKALNRLDGAAIIIAASGMAEAGRILHHLKNHASDPKNAILFVGFQAEHTLGRRLQEGRNPVRILGVEQDVAAEVISIDGYSAHGDHEEMRRWIRGLGGPITRAFCVHGEPTALQAMKSLLEEEGVGEVHIPAHGERVVL